MSILSFRAPHLFRYWNRLGWKLQVSKERAGHRDTEHCQKDNDKEDRLDLRPASKGGIGATSNLEIGERYEDHGARK